MCQTTLNSWSNTVTMYWTMKLIREVSYMTSYTYSSIAVHYIGHDKTNSGRTSISWPVCELFLEVAGGKWYQREHCIRNVLMITLVASRLPSFHGRLRLVCKHRATQTGKLQRKSCTSALQLCLFIVLFGEKYIFSVELWEHYWSTYW